MLRSRQKSRPADQRPAGSETREQVWIMAKTSKNQKVKIRRRSEKEIKPAQSGSLSRADKKFLLDGQRRLIKTFRQVAKGRTARMLDDAFEDFDLPLAARRRRQSTSPSGIVLSLRAIIRLSELNLYEVVLNAARSNSLELQDLKTLINRCNKRIQRILMRSGIVYRGMNLEEFEIIAKSGGIIGQHHRMMHAAKDDFVSFSISSIIAMSYAIFKNEQGLLIEADVSGMNKSEYEAINYGVRNDIGVTRGGRRIYRPYEKFGGDQSCMLLYEFEVRLRVNSRPIIRKVVVVGDRPARFKRRLERVVARLERAQKSTITIKYMQDQTQPWRN